MICSVELMTYAILGGSPRSLSALSSLPGWVVSSISIAAVTSTAVRPPTAAAKSTPSRAKSKGPSENRIVSPRVLKNPWPMVRTSSRGTSRAPATSRSLPPTLARRAAGTTSRIRIAIGAHQYGSANTRMMIDTTPTSFVVGFSRWTGDGRSRYRLDMGDG